MNGWDASQKVSIVLLALMLSGIGVYDVIAGLYFGPLATISVVILAIAKAHPILPLAVGVLIGHLFWPQ